MNNKLQQLKRFIPPIVYDLKNKFTGARVTWHGDYSCWGNVLKVSSGYDADNILARVKYATAKVRDGEAVFERDSVLFDKVQYSWPVLAGLLKVAAMNHGQLRVLDFGGALGSSYYQNRNFLSDLKELKWSVVEQENFVTCGKHEFENRQLNFFYTIEEAIENYDYNVILLSSVLPYLEHPYKLIEKIIKLEIDTIIIDRTPVLEGASEDRLTLQHIPSSIYKASYPAYFLGEIKLLASFTNTYNIITDFSSINNTIVLQNPATTAIDKGYIFEKRKL